jgi:uncharacterized protein YbaA (DUF1428 family)
MDAAEIKARYDALWGIRKTAEQTWDLIEKYICPLHGGKFFQDQTSEHEIDWRRGRDLFDSTAILAGTTLASSVHGAITAPNSRWFDFRFRDTKLNTEDAPKEWLQDCSERVWYALQESDFNLQINEAYQDLVCFGTSCLVEEAESETEWLGLDFSTLPIREIYFEQNHKGQIENFYRRYEWTPLQIVTKFGKDAPESMKEKAKQAQQADQKHVVIFAIYPRKDKRNVDTSKVQTPKNRPFGSKFVLHDTAEQIGDDGGHYEMPAFMPRWLKTSGSMWGYGPGTIALSDVMTLNTMVEQRLAAAAKVIDPPSLVTERGLMSDLDLTSGGQTVVRDINGIRPYESGARFDVADGLIMDLRININKIFLVDRLELKESPAMTATEVNARFDLMQRLLGPVLGRLQTDLLDPMIERTFKILARSGQLLPIPEQLKGFNPDMDVMYIGPMARAQKSDSIGMMTQWAGMMGEMAQMFPETAVLVDGEKLGRELAEAMNVPATIVRSGAEVAEIADAKQKAALQERQLQLAMGQGQAAESLGKGAKSMAESGMDMSQAEGMPVQ